MVTSTEEVAPMERAVVVGLGTDKVSLALDDMWKQRVDDDKAVRVVGFGVAEKSGR